MHRSVWVPESVAALVLSVPVTAAVEPLVNVTVVAAVA
jgi:hypothetical protein